MRCWPITCPAPASGLTGASFRSTLAANFTGILGLPIKVATTIVIAFVLFGAVLQHTGGMQFFTDISMALMGRFRGGAAKIAVLGSCLFGSISGSAVANVVATGVVTIPLMKRAGYPAHKAGRDRGGGLDRRSIDAAGDGRGRLSHRRIPGDVLRHGAIAAIVPGLLYYIALFIQADLEAAKEGIPPVEPKRHSARRPGLARRLVLSAGLRRSAVRTVRCLITNPKRR